MSPAYPKQRLWILGVVGLSVVVLAVGCVAQQADVVRIKRELDAKIHELNKSKTSLQQAVTDANAALDKANTVIAGQRAEIKELLHARAEVMDQVATLKDTDLSQVRGAIEHNQHQVNSLDEKLGALHTQMQTVREKVDQSQAALEPLVAQLQEQMHAEEQLLTEQGGKLGEFRTSLLDYQGVLAALQKNVSQQNQQMVAIQQHVDQITQEHVIQHQQVQTDIQDVRQHMQSVIGTMEKITTTMSGRLDAYEQQRSSAVRQADTAKVVPEQTAASFMNLRSKETMTSSALARQSEIRSQRFGSQSNAPLLELESSPVRASLSSRRSTPRTSIKAVTKDVREAYQQAFNLLRARKYVAAARKFSGFLRTFPESPLAANSQYWLGECYYGQRRFQEAIDEFERVFALYPSSNKVPASLLKIGYSHLELQQPTMARSVFQQVVRAYPQSPEAIKAHGRLQEVNALLHNPS